MKKHILALAAVAAVVASPAFAATVIQTHTISAANTPASTAFSFAQFDSSLGALNSVTLSFNADLSTTGTLANPSSGGHTYTLSQSALAGLSGGGFNLDASLLSSSSSQYTLLGRNKAGYHPASVALSGAGSDTDTLSSGLVTFIGAGDLDFIFSRASHFSINPSAGALSLASSIWGDATLTYDYTAAPISGPVGGVPEPGTWSLLILGFAGLGAALRRRRWHEGAAAIAT